MKVNETNIRGAGVASTGKAAELDATHRGSSAGASGTGSSTDDRVELSKLSSRVQAADENSPERQARLEQLRHAVADDKYQVDEHAVSRAIVEDAQRGDVKG